MAVLVELLRFSPLPMRLFTDHLLEWKANEQLIKDFSTDGTFYVKIHWLSKEKVSKKMVYIFKGRQKGLPQRPGIILTTIGVTKGTRHLALQEGLLIMTFAELTDHLRYLNEKPADRRNNDIKFF